MDDTQNTQPTEEQVAQYGQDTEAIDQLHGSQVQAPVGQAVPTTAPATPIAPIQAVPPDQSQNPAEKQSMAMPQKANQQPNLVPQATPPPTNPAVKKASTMYDIAQALAGGPRYKYNVDINTGEMKREPVPVSGKHLGLAIALEALSGGLTGLAAGRGRGPGAAGAAALAQSEDRVKQQDNQARAQANADYARGAAIAQTNMHMALNERSLAEADINLHQRDVDTYAPIYDAAVKEGAVDRDGITEDEANKLLQNGSLHVTKDMLIPTRVVPQMDASGKQAKGPNGEPLYQKEYALLRPMATINLPDDVKKTLVDNKVPGYVDKDGKAIDLPNSYRPRLQMVMDGIEQARTMQIGDSVLNGLQKMRNGAQGHPLHSGSPGTAPSDNNMPVLKDTGLAQISDQAADKHSVAKELLRAVALQESGGNANTKNSVAGAIGPYQIMPATGQQFGATPEDLKDPVKNADVAAQYLNQLIQKHNGDERAALVDYHGKGADALGMTGDKYADQVLAKIPQGQDNGPQLSANDLHQLTTGLTPKQSKLLTQWKLFYDGGPEKASSMEKSTESIGGKPPVNSPQDVGVVKNLLDQVYPMADYHNDQAQAVADRQVKTAENKAADVQAVQDAESEKSKRFLTGIPDSFVPPPDLLDKSLPEIRQTLKDAGVPTPPNLADLVNVARNQSQLSTHYASKVYAHASQISAQDAGTYINQALDPGWNEGKFKLRNDFIGSLRPSSSASGPGNVIYNGGVATQHLDLAEKLFKNIDNKQSPVWNEAVNWLGARVAGLPPAAVYDLVAGQLANEVSKVTSGTSSPTLEASKTVRDQLGNYQSPGQAAGKFSDLISLMKPRFDGLAHDAEGWKATKEYKQYVDPQMLKVFGEHGMSMRGYGQPFADKDGHFIGFTQDGGKTYTPVK